MDRFHQRVAVLPTLGVGISTEYGAAQSSTALDIGRLRREAPQFAGFLELGTEILVEVDVYHEGLLSSSPPL